MMNKKLRKICTRRKKVILGLSVIMITVFFIIVKECIDRRNIMTEMNEPVILAFPLRGEWLSPNTPGTKIPSHGTNRFGTRYAYDFIQVDWNRGGYPAYRVSFIQYLLFGVNLENYYCWGQDVYAPCNGIVVAAEDGYKERLKTNLFSDMSNAYKNAHYFNNEHNLDVEIQQSVAGRYHDTEAMKFKKVEETTAATLTFKGQYDLLPEANGEIMRWITDNHYRLDGKRFNIYHVSPEKEDSTGNMVTEVCFPVKPL